jgi:hypothetical protein
MYFPLTDKEHIMTHPIGKGMLIWDLTSCCNGNTDSLVTQSLLSGFSWISLKITNGILPFSPYDHQSTYPALLSRTTKALQGAGISVWGWGYTYGVSDLYAQSEATAVVEAMYTHTLDGFLIDAESEYKKPGAYNWAMHYMDILRRDLPDTPLGLCSYRFPSLHREFPWNAFVPRCDFHAPQVYWEGSHTPGAQLERSIRELTAKRYLPIIPIGAAYTTGTWSPTVADLDEFNAKALSVSLPGCGWWSWQHAEAIPEWWNAISAHKWNAIPVVSPIPVLTLEKRVENLELAAISHGWALDR